MVCNSSDLVKDLIDQFLADGVVTTSVVVASILLARDHLIRVEERSIGASPDLIDDVGLEIAVDGSWDIFAVACRWSLVSAQAAVRSVFLTSLREESAKALISIGGLSLLGQVAIRLDAVLEAVELQVVSVCTLYSTLRVESSLRTSQQELAIWQPAWPTTNCQYQSCD